MAERKKTPPEVEVEVLKRCRRRCAICFGLARDEAIKSGQIAHLDGKPSNVDFDNLAFLCLEHHDQYDSSTSQSKSLTLREVKAYRSELESRFLTWKSEAKLNQFLNFLEDQVDLEGMADAAEKAAGRYVWYARQLAVEALSQAEVQYCDMDLWGPLLATLDHFQSWGWLTYTLDKKENEDGMDVIHVEVDHQPNLRDLSKLISKRGPDGHAK